MLVHNILIHERYNILEICLSTTSGNHTINHVHGADKTIHNQPDTMFPHFKQVKYHHITLSLNNSRFLHINHHM